MQKLRRSPRDARGSSAAALRENAPALPRGASSPRVARRAWQALSVPWLSRVGSASRAHAMTENIPRPAPKPRKSGRRKPKPLTRSPMKSRGPRTQKSGGHLFPEGVSEPRRAFVRALPCLLGGPWRARLACDKQGRFFEHRCFGKVQACHLKSRGSGGKDAGNLWPGCAGAHEEQHRIGTRRFEERWSEDLAAVCEHVEYRFLQTVAAGAGDPGTPE
jgi:hypothetical protein